MSGYPIRKSAHQGIFAPKRGLSQLITSFIACESQGIRHTPFTTFARLLVMRIAPHGRLIILSAFLYSCLLLSCVQYVKDLYGHRSMASGGTAGLEPVLAAGLDTLVPLCI